MIVVSATDVIDSPAAAGRSPEKADVSLRGSQRTPFFVSGGSHLCDFCERESLDTGNLVGHMPAGLVDAVNTNEFRPPCPGASFLPLGDNGRALPAEEERPLFYMVAGYKYRSAAVVTDEPAPTDPDAVQLVDAEELRGEPGTRVPHAWVQRDGARISTLDLLGTGFTLFTGSAGTPWVAAADEVATALRVPIEVHLIGPDADIRDVGGGWAQLTGLSPDAALLVRPDDFVAWRAQALPESPGTDLHQVLCRILGRN